MKLSEFIESNALDITREFVDYARGNFEGLGGMEEDVVRNHITHTLRQVAEEMDSSRNNGAASGSGKREKKGKDRDGGDSAALSVQARGARGAQAGMTISHICAEYKYLREAVLRRWIAQKQAGTTQNDNMGEVIRFNKTIDSAMNTSVRTYHKTVEEGRDMFIGILGDDIRNPLSTIGSTASLLLRSRNLSDRERTLGRQIQISASHITAITNNLLEFTRIRMGDYTMNIRPTIIRLEEICRASIDEALLSYPEADIRLEAPERLEANLDVQRLEIILSNLVRNALQHGDRARPVTVSAEKEGNGLMLKVHNYGPIISPKHVEKVLDGKSIPQGGRKTGNLGLGLYVVHQLVMAHKGRIGITSTPENGTTFKVHIP